MWQGYSVFRNLAWWTTLPVVWPRVNHRRRVREHGGRHSVPVGVGTWTSINPRVYHAYTYGVSHGFTTHGHHPRASPRASPTGITHGSTTHGHHPRVHHPRVPTFLWSQRLCGPNGFVSHRSEEGFPTNGRESQRRR